MVATQTFLIFTQKIGGWFQNVSNISYFYPYLFGEDVQFDYKHIFADGLKPPWVHLQPTWVHFWTGLSGPLDPTVVEEKWQAR